MSEAYRYRTPADSHSLGRRNSTLLTWLSLGVLFAPIGLVGICATKSDAEADQSASTPDVGSVAYMDSCASCHGRTLAGTLGPSLNDDSFRAKWNAKGGNALRDFISKSMPPADPAGLPQETYDKITTFIQRANHMSVLDIGGTTVTVDAKASPEGGEGAGIGPEIENRDSRYLAALAGRSAVLAALTPVSEMMLRNPPAADWISWRRTDDGQGFSPLTQINRDNASSLSLAWSLTLPPGTNAITPLVVGGVMFLNSHGTVLAIDVKSSEILWKFVRPRSLPPFGPPVTQPRGMAIFEDRLFVSTIDNHMIALDVHTGKVLWDRLIRAMHGLMRFSANPIVVHGKLIQGASGCWGTGESSKCFVVALDSKTGEELWRFNTIPRSGEIDGDTWNGAPDDKRSGASLWSTGTYDPENNLVFFGTGQTYHIAPLMFPSGPRRHVNSGLYTDSTLALNPDTGKLVWYYQHMARDVWDLDWAFERILATLTINSKPMRVVMTMGKLGILDVLDAKRGRYLFSYDLGLQNLVTAIDPVTGWKTTNPALEPDPMHTKFICPYAIGVRNWPATSYDPTTHLLYVATGDACMDYKWNVGEDFDIGYGSRPRPGGDGNTGSVAALNLATRKLEWSKHYRAPESSATLSTAGGVIFEGGRDRRFRASDSASGEVLWQVQLDNVPSAAPITFAADGVQFVAITSGGGNPNDALRRSLTPEIDTLPHATTLWVFRLRDAVAGGARGSQAVKHPSVTTMQFMHNFQLRHPFSIR